MAMTGSITRPPEMYSNAQLVAALERVADAVIITNEAAVVTYANAAAQVLTGWLHGAALGRPLRSVFRIVHADTGAMIDGILGLARLEGINRQVWRQALLMGQALRPVMIDYSVVSCEGSAEHSPGTIVLFRDVSRRHDMEMALQNSEKTLLANAEALFEEKERAQVTLESIGDAVISTDFRGQITFLNAAAQRITGWTQTDAAGRLIDEVVFLVDAQTRDHCPCPTTKAIIEDRTLTIEGPCMLVRRDGTDLAIEQSASPIHDKHGGVIGAVLVVHDVSVARSLANKLARSALHDPLTDLPNRALLADRVEQALTLAHRYSTAVAVLFIDLDHFKSVNDTLGHDVGDALLCDVTQRLLHCVRSSDTVSRIGGDEFVVLLAGASQPEDAAACAEKLLRALNLPYDVAGHRLNITASIGIARFPQDAPNGDILLKRADTAMYQAKLSGRNGFRVWTPGADPGS
jgi:diguanylate cyclase (GGDEF)-like protein/PAS domain S-box-containing protein